MLESKGKTNTAVSYFYLADNYVRILQTDLAGLSGEMSHEVPSHTLARKVLGKVTDQDISDNPISAVRVIMELFGGLFHTQ